MCLFEGGGSEREKAEVSLAREFKSELDITIEPQKLRLFIRKRWSRVAALAHRIHDSAPTEAEEAEERLKTAARNIAALSEEGVMNAVRGACHSTVRKDFLLIAEKIKFA